MNRKQWLEERKTGIGGSEASAILGMNPYLDIQKLYKLKTGLLEAPDISDKQAVKYGLQAENALRRLFVLDFPQYEVYHRRYEILRNEKYPFILGSLDGILTDKETGKRGVLEIKTTNILQSMHLEKWNDRIPQNYFIQVLHYLLVTGFDFAVLKAQLKRSFRRPDGSNEIKIEVRHYHLSREKHVDDLAMLEKHEVKFWTGNIEKRIPPPLVLPAI